MSLPSLLYVDGDPRDRSSLGFLLKGSYNFIPAATLAEARAVLAQGSIDLVLCDHQLEDGSGLEFLVELQQAYPYSFRMLLTGITTGDQIVRAINQGHIYYYFQKPLQESELRMVLDHAMELRSFKTQNAELISSLESKNDDLEKSETLFRSLLEHVPDGILICNSTGNIVMANQSAETIFQCQRRELTGQPVDQLFVEKSVPETHQDSLAHGVSMRRLDGSIFPAELTKNLARTPETTLTVMVIRDITERKNAEIQLRDLNVRLEQKVKERTIELERVNRQLSRQEKRKDILRRVASAANSSLYDSALETCLWEICRFLDLEFGQIWFVTPADLLEKSGISCAPRFAGPRSANWSGDYLLSLLESNQDILILHHTPPEAAEILVAGHSTELKGSVLAFPVRVKGRVEAIFEFISRNEIKPDDWSRGIIQDIAVEMSELFLRRSLETARLQVLVALQHSETRFRNLVESANAISWEMAWPGYELQYVSPGAENILGFSREFWYEEGFWDSVVFAEDRQKFEDQMNDCITGNDQVSFEIRLNTLDGQFRWLRCFAHPQHTRGNTEADKLSGIMFDITELKHAQEAAIQASVAKSAFLAMMSHELRTPLNGVIGLVELLARTGLDGDQRHMLSTMRDSAFSLLHLIDDILDFSKIEAGRLEVENIGFNLPLVVESVAENLAYTAAGKNLRMELIIEPGVPRFVLGDPIRFRQVLMNLAGNALKFTRNSADMQGLVLVRVSPSVEQNAEPGWFRVQVEDNGIGMSEDTRTKLFQPFTQGEESTTRRFGGTGLGLSICARLVELMNSRISVQSLEGSGSTFQVDFRLSLDSAAKDKRDDPPQAEPRSVVLALVSDQYEAESVTTCLAWFGYGYRLYRDWSDLLLGLIDCKESSAAPIVILGLYGATEERNLTELLAIRSDMRVIQLIVRGHLPGDQPPALILAYGNPLLPSDLKCALDGFNLNESSPSESELALTDRFSQLRVESNPGTRRILLAEDNETNQMVIMRQLEVLGYQAFVANDGRQALELYQTESFDLILTDCHMPIMDGFELTAAIRAQETGTKRIPIIAITANAVQGERERCLAAGFNDCVTKPVGMRILQQVLQTWTLQGYEEAAKVANNLADSTGNAYTEEVTPDFDPQTLEDFIGPDAENQLLMLDSFVRNLGTLAEGIKGALESNDQETAARLGHTLKSSARAVGALRLSKICGQLESSFRNRQDPSQQITAAEFMLALDAVRNAIETRAR